MKKILIGVGHVISVLLVISSIGLGLTIMLKPSLLLDVITWLEGVITYLGWKNYLLMGGVGFIESIPFLNIAFPGQTFMILIAGFVAQKTFLLAMLIVVLACTLGDMVAYLVGRYKGNSILRHYGPTFGITPEYVDKIKEMTHDHAHRALFASKWNSYTRGMVPFIAGTSHMKFWDFMFYNILGSIVYGGVIVYLAKLFIGHYDKVVPYVRWIGLGIVGIVVIGYIIKYRKKHGKTG